MANPAEAPQRSKRALIVGVVLVGALAAMPAASAATVQRLHFATVTSSVGISTEPARTWGASWTDFDTDGDADLFVSRHWWAPQLYRNDGGSYTRVTDNAFRAFRVDRHSCAWGEANLDGRPDLFCARGAGKGEGEGANQLFVNSGNGFQDRAEDYGVDDPYGRGRAANWLDDDGDGDLDLFVANHRRSIAPNVLFHNDAGSVFRRAHVGLGESLASVTASWADWDRDGDGDVLVFRYKPRSVVAYENVRGHFRRTFIPHVTDGHWLSGSFGDYNNDGWIDLHLVRPRSSVVLRNARGAFRKVSVRKLQHGRMSAWLDVENDGDLDLFVVQGNDGKTAEEGTSNRPDLILHNRRGRFVKVFDPSWRGPRSGNADSVAVADHDRDGLVDVFVTNGYFRYFGKPVLLENRSLGLNWTALDLVGPPSNPLAIGARVVAKTGTKTLRRHLTDEFAFRAQSEPGYVHLGLNRAAAADVKVRWPDGTVDCVTAPATRIVPVPIGSFPCP